MDPIQKWRDSIAWFVAAVTVSLGYELKVFERIDLPIIKSCAIETAFVLFLSSLVLLLSLSIALFFSKKIISIAFVRRLIMGEDFVEGHWHLITDKVEEHSSLSADGVLWLRYMPDDGQYAVTTTRLDRNGIRYEVPSRIVHMRKDGQQLLYVNLFIITHSGIHPTEGVSKGFFTRKGKRSGRKDNFDAFIYSETEHARHQGASLITNKQIKECIKVAQKKYPHDLDGWKVVFLQDKKYQNETCNCQVSEKN